MVREGGLFLPLGRIGVSVTSFFSTHLVRNRPALYQKKPPYMFEIAKNIFSPHLDMPRGVFGLSDRRSVAPSSGVFRRRLQVIA